MLYSTRNPCHITRVIANLEIPRESFSDRYPQPNMAAFEFDSIVVMFLYQYARGFSQIELYRRLKGAAYVWLHFELPRPPTQQAISYIWRNRLSLADRQAIKATAHAIRDVASDHDIISDGEPASIPRQWTPPRSPTTTSWMPSQRRVNGASMSLIRSGQATLHLRTSSFSSDRRI